MAFKTTVQLAPLAKGTFENEPITTLSLTMEKVPDTIDELLKCITQLKVPKTLYESLKRITQVGEDSLMHVVDIDVWPNVRSYHNYPLIPITFQRALGDLNHLQKGTKVLAVILPQDILYPSRKFSESVPLILLDVDGVINLLGKEKKWKKIYPDMKTTNVCGSTFHYPVKWSPTIIERINRWGTVAKIMWLTSWDIMAKVSLAPALGLHTFNVATFTKFGTAEKLTPQDMNRTIVWIDDELHGHYGIDSIESAKRALEKVHQRERLFVDPGAHYDSHGVVGLMPEDMDRVDAFLGL